MQRRKPPDKALLLRLEPYAGLPLTQVRVPQTPDELAAAKADLLAQPIIGFDTESKPVFVRTESPSAPAVVQFATPTVAYIVQLYHPGAADLAKCVLSAPAVLKAGFGVQQDQRGLTHLLGEHARPLLDIDLLFHRQGYPRSIGIKSAVALVFNRRLVKSKRVSTSNWANRVLTPQQLAYAANDAWVALQVLTALGPIADWPVWQQGHPPLPPESQKRSRDERRRHPQPRRQDATARDA